MRVTIDLMKKSTQIVDLSNVINPRVGDDDLQLPLHIGYGDNLFDMRGKDVEFLSNDPNKKNIYIAGTCNTNTPGDNLYMGDLTFRFPAGTFQADGTYDPDKTMFRIVDKETQKAISSVNVKITVMKNAIEFDFDPDKTSYDSRLENMLHDFHDKGQSMLDEIKDLNNQAKSNVSGDTAATANEAKKQADQNAGDISDLKGEVAGARGRFANMAGREDAQDAAINQKESIANANANYAELKRKDAQQDAEIASKAGKFELEDKLAQMHVEPEGFENLDDLKAKYPNGNSNLNVTVDNGHLLIWFNNAWNDCGQYQAAGLSAEVKRQIGDLLDGFFKDYLIKNGSFSSGEVAPAFAVGSPAANLTVVNFNGRNWLRIDSDSNVSYGGVAWKIPKGGLSFPLHLEADIHTDDATELDFYLLGTDANGSYVNNSFSQTLYSINNEQNATSHVAFDFNLSPELASASNLELRIQVPGEKIIHGISITGVRSYSMYSYDKEYNDNFLANTINKGYMNDFSAIGTDDGKPFIKKIVNINNKNWLAISASKGTWNGLEITDVPNPNVVLKADCPIHFETNIWNQNKDLSLDVNLVGTKEDGTQFIQFIKTIPLIANKITKLEADIQIAPELRNSSDLSIKIQCADETDLQDLKFSDFVLKFVSATSDAYNDNLLQQHELSNLPLACESSGDMLNIDVIKQLNQQWLRLLVNEAKGYSGFMLRSVAINPYDTFYFKSDLLSPNQTNLNIYAIGLDRNGAIIGTNHDAILIKSLAIKPNEVNHVACNFKLPSTMQSASFISIKIQQPDEKPLSLMLGNAKLAYDNPTVEAKNLIPMGNLSHNSLPQANAITTSSKYSFSTAYLNGEEWLQLDLPDVQGWQGIGWDVDISNVDLTRELELRLDLTSSDYQRLNIYAVPYDNTGTITLNNKTQLIAEVYLPGNNNSICHLNRHFKLGDQFKDTSFIDIKIQQVANGSLTILEKDICLWYAEDSVSDKFWDYNLPIVKINGDLSGMTKDDAKQVTYEYRNGNTVLTGYAKLKWQGNSSAMWDKKGYRLQPFTDDTYSQKEKVQFVPSWSPTSKINLKAYYTDGLLSRDVVNANIGADIASTNFSLPSDLKQEDNFGFIDGFPIALIINDEFEGIYSFNTARSDFDYVKYGIMGNGYTNVTNFTSANKADVKLDGSDFESLNPETVTDDEKSAVGDLVTWVATSTDENFKADFGKHLDLKTTIDYFILGNLLASADSFGKNQIFLSWDGVKWFMQAYDLDTTFGVSWDGKKQDLPTGLTGTGNNLFKRLSKLFSAEISARYAELRTWLTPAYVLDKYKKRINTIGVSNYQREFAKWNNPSKDFATYKQLKDAVNHQFSLLDQIWLNK